MNPDHPPGLPPDSSSKHPLRPNLSAAIVFLLSAVVASLLVWRTEELRLQIERARVSDLAGDHAHALQANIERALSATYSLAALVRQGKGDTSDFDTAAGEMLPFYPGAASLQLAPGGVVRRIVPLAGNEGAIGHDLLKDPARTKEAFLARDTGKLTLAGPFNLLQGGVGAAGRLPVSLDNGKGGSSFWGFAIVLIRFPEVLDPDRLSNLVQRGFSYELWRTHPDTGNKQIIAASSQASLIDPVERLLEVPNGTWTLSVAPVSGWGDPRGLTLKATFGLLFSLLLFGLSRTLINTRNEAKRIAKHLTADLRESEMRYRDIFDNVLDGLYLLEVTGDGHFRTIEINPALERATGIPRDLVLGKTQEESVPEETARIVNAKYRRCIEAGRPIEEEVHLDLPAGCRYFHSTLIPARNASGRIHRIVGISRDITERKQAEAELARVNRALRLLSDSNQALIRITDEAALLNEVCRIVVDVGGYRMAWVGFAEQDEAKTLRPMAHAGFESGYLESAMITWADSERGCGPSGTAVRTGKPCLTRNTQTDPSFVPWREEALRRGYQASVALPLIGDGLTFGALSIYAGEADAFETREVDILSELAGDLAFGITALRAQVEHRRAEQLRAAQHALLIAILNSSRDFIIFTLDRNYCYTAFNEKHREEMKKVWNADISIGMNLLECMKIPELRELAKQSINRALQGDVFTEVQYQPGANIYYELIWNPVVQNGSIVGATVFIRDITKRKLAEETLREREAFIHSILDSVDEGFIVVDRHYRIVSANRAFCDMMKLPEDRVVGRMCYEMTHHVTRPCFEANEDCAVRRTFETGAVNFAFHTHSDTSGAKQYVELKSYPLTDASGTVVSAIETVNDVTQRRKLEDQLRQAQKMEDIGTLAGGVAHDFNNMLTAIIGYSSMVKLKMKPDDPLQASIDQVLSASERAAHLTQGLLAFSRKQVINPKPVDVRSIITSVEKLLRRLIGEDVDLLTQLAGNDLVVMADASQIEQVLMNLATNARDAMPEGGALTIATEEIELGADFIRAHGFGKQGKYALISVSDTGLGMDEKTREKIFEPFFTTKEPGRGTGLGLAIVYGIVKQHEGAINVYSERGKGTTFKIYLPIIVPSVGETTAQAPAPPRGGTETILLAEDNPEVRNLTIAILKDFGYRVIAAADGQEAIDTCSAHAADIDLLLVDVIMPKKSGRDVYDAARAIRPGIKVVFTSGYPADFISRKGVFDEGLPFVSKPASPDVLLRKIREVLDATP